MTEEAWLTISRQHRMLRHVAGVATDRRLRLVAVACQRWSFPYRGADEEVILSAVERVADRVETQADIELLARAVPEMV